MIHTRRAQAEDISEITALYDALHRSFELGENTAGFGWKAGVYPTKQTALTALSKQSLFVLTVGNRITGDCITSDINVGIVNAGIVNTGVVNTSVVAGVVILDSQQDANYHLIDWSVPAPDEEILVIHTLAVHPAFRGQKIGRALAELAIDHGKHNGYRAIRLDTWTGNAPANALYKQVGFTHLATGKLALEHLKERDFNFYEYVL